MANKIIINGVKWSLEVTDDIKKLTRNNGSVTIGMCDSYDLTIYILNGLDYNTFKNVMIHELVHAYMFSYNYYLDEDEEEFICEFITHYAEDILNDSERLINMALKNF